VSPSSDSPVKSYAIQQKVDDSRPIEQKVLIDKEEKKDKEKEKEKEVRKVVKNPLLQALHQETKKRS